MSEKIIWNYCSACNQDTKHDILFEKNVDETDDHLQFIVGEKIYRVLACCGCETVSFRLDYIDTLGAEMTGTHRLHPDNISVDIYPQQLKNRKELNYYYLPNTIKLVYAQTMLALKGESKLLAAVGFRAILEAICIEEKIKGGNLEQKINNLSKNRLITEKEAERLHTIRFLGNDSVHEMEMPSDKKLSLVLDIIEHLLKNLYLLDVDAKYYLDTIIKEYNDFQNLVVNCLEKFVIGETKSLRQILGKHIRRIYGDTSSLEKELIKKIDSDEFDFLEVDLQKSTLDTTYYLIKKIHDDMPF